MVRLTDTTASQILLLLAVIKARTPNGYTLRSAGQDYTEAVQSNTTEVLENFSDTTQALMQDVVYRSTREGWIDVPVVNIVNTLATALTESMAKVNKDRNLIDELAEILKLPLPENRLGNVNIEKLQKALLTPSEIKTADVALNLAAACPNCGHEYTSGEAVTARLWDRGAKDVHVFTCLRCNIPNYVPCSEEGCEHYVDSGRARLGKTNYCPNHASAKSVHEPSAETLARRAEKQTKELEEGLALREARERATKVRYVVDPNAPPQRGGGGPTPAFRRAYGAVATNAPRRTGGLTGTFATTTTATGGVDLATGNPTVNIPPPPPLAFVEDEEDFPTITLDDDDDDGGF